MSKRCKRNLEGKWPKLVVVVSAVVFADCFLNLNHLKCGLVQNLTRHFLDSNQQHMDWELGFLTLNNYCSCFLLEYTRTIEWSSDDTEVGIRLVTGIFLTVHRGFVNSCLWSLLTLIIHTYVKTKTLSLCVIDCS